MYHVISTTRLAEREAHAAVVLAPARDLLVGVCARRTSGREERERERARARADHTSSEADAARVLKRSGSL